jgi:hypothetical protein
MRDSSQRSAARYPLTAHAERVHVRVALIDKAHVHDRRAVGVDRHRVLGEVGVRNPPGEAIHHRMLHRCHADAADP